MRSRPGTIGPFTGRQITTLLCVIVVMVLFPVGAHALSGTTTFVTDAVTGKTASVDAAGQLQVKAANGAAVKVQGSTSGNKLDVTKDQQVLATEANPSSYYESSNELTAGNSWQTVLRNPLPTGEALIVKSVLVGDFNSASLDDPYFGLAVFNGANCTGSGGEDSQIDLPSGSDATIAVPFDPGLVVPAGGTLCVSGNDTAADISVTGYTLPAADAGTSIAGSPLNPAHRRHGS